MLNVAIEKIKSEKRDNPQTCMYVFLNYGNMKQGQKKKIQLRILKFFQAIPQLLLNNFNNIKVNLKSQVHSDSNSRSFF